MPIFDQYEVEVMSSYSGSYTDSIMQGTIFGNDPANTRTKIASRVAGVNIENLANKLISRNEYVSYARKNISNTVGSSTKNLFLNLQTNETIYDSLLPSAGGIILKDGKELPYLNYTDGTTNQTFSGEIPANSNLNTSEISDGSIFSWFSPNGITPNAIFPLENFSDTTWIFSFPFQSKYKDLKRSNNQLNFLEKITINQTLDGTAITPITTTKIGSIFYVLKDEPGVYKNYTQYSQMWSVTSSFATPASNTTTQTMNHVPLASYNGLQSVYYNNFKAVNISASYSAFGSLGTILTSSNGMEWDTVSSEHGDYFTDISNSPYQIPIQINSWTNDTGSILEARPIGYNDGTTDGNHYQWIALVQYGLAGSKLIRNANRGQPTLKTNAPTRDNWELVDIDTSLSITADLYNIMNLDIGGQRTVAGSTQTVCLIGQDTLTSPDTGLIVFGDKDCGTFTRNTNPFGIANLANAIWLSCDFQISSPKTYMYFCGINKGTSPYSGLIGQGEFNTAFNNPAGSTINNRTALAATAWGGTLPIVRSIATNPITGTTIVVGNNGMILKCTAIDLSSGWSVKTPANSFSGTFIDVKLRYGTVDQGDWIIVGDDGVVQYSSDDGDTWHSGNTEQPNISSGIGVSVMNPASDTIAYGASYHALYAGSREKYVLNSLNEPQYIFAGGGELVHAFNATGNDTVLVAKIADISGSNYVSNDLFKTPILPLTTSIQVRPKYTEYNKAFFGFGDGVSIDLTPYQYGGSVNVIGSKGRSPSVLDFSLYDMYGSVNEVAQVLIHKIGIRGWKYGIYGYNLQQKQIFRRNHFGQFRDILEGRLTTATIMDNVFNPYTNRLAPRTLFYPLQVSFVSGTTIYNQSIDYLSATNPSYNPYDSGIYDIHYRSGQPFFDRDNED